MDTRLKDLLQRTRVKYIDIVNNESLDKITKLFCDNIIFEPLSDIEFLYVGLYYRKIDNYKNALYYYKKIKCAFEHMNVAYNNIGCVYYIKGKYDKAIINYTMAFKLGYIDSIHDLLCCYQYNNNYVMFICYIQIYIQYCDKVSDLNPENIAYAERYMKINIESETLMSS